MLEEAVACPESGLNTQACAILTAGFAGAGPTVLWQQYQLHVELSRSARLEPACAMVALREAGV